jgi:hypothetical protein
MGSLRAEVRRLLARRPHIPQTGIARIARRAIDQAGVEMCREIRSGVEPAVALEHALRAACDLVAELIVFAPGIPEMIRGGLKRHVAPDRTDLQGPGPADSGQPTAQPERQTPREWLEAAKPHYGTWEALAESASKVRRKHDKAAVTADAIFRILRGEQIKSPVIREAIAQAVTQKLGEVSGVCRAEDLLWPAPQE